MEQEILTKRFGYLVFRSDGTLDSKILSEPMNDAVQAELITITSVIQKVRPVMFAAQIAQQNLRELKEFEERNGVAKPFSELASNTSDETMFNRNIDAARHILNFLCSFRAFLDQCDEYLCNHYGKKSKQRMSFLGETNNQFDNKFSYRFAYKLRNFSQHFSIPISNATMTSSLDHKKKEFALLSRILLERDDLLRWREWGKVRADLEKMPHNFGVLPIMGEVGVSITELCIGALRPEGDRLETCCNYLSKLYKTMDLEENAIPVVWVGENTASNLPPSKMELLPLGELRLIIKSMGAPAELFR